MANIKISELNELTQKENNDFLPIVDSSTNETKKISVGNLTPSNDKLVHVGTSVDENYRVNVLHSRNMFDKNNVIPNYRLDNVGDAFSDSLYTLSNFIKVKPNTTYTISGISTGNYGCYALYQENRTFISRSAFFTNSTTTFTTTSTTTFIRITDVNANINSLQLEEGSTATPYEPYIVPSINVDNEEIYNDENKDAISNLMAQLRFVGRYSTRNTRTFNFTDTNAARKCYIIVITKDSTDGEFSGIWFIRTGARGVGKIVQTGASTVDMTASLSADTMTCTFSGDTVYCIINVYQILNY